MRTGGSSPSLVVIALLLAVLIAVAYGGSLRNEFVFDDMIFMQRDPRLQSVTASLRLFVEPLWGFSDQEGRTHLHQYYRPLQTFPLSLSRAVFGEAAWPSHVLNLALHWLNSLLAFVIIRHFVGAGAAAVAAVLFALHPGYSEAILWISNVAGLGAAASTLLIVALHMSPVAQRWSAQLAIAGLFLIGLWFKEGGVLAPVLLVLYDLIAAPDRGWSRLWRMRWRYLVFVPPFALYYALRLRALGGALPGMETASLGPWETLINAVALLPQYVVTFVWPVDLNMYHDFNAIADVWTGRFWIGMGIILAAVAVVAGTLRSAPTIAFGVLWAAVCVAPHLLIRWPKLNVYAERYLYLPVVGAFLVLAYLGVRATVRAPLRRVAVAGAGILALLFVVAAVRRTPDWHDELTLYEKTLRQSPRAELIRNNLAILYLESGRYDDGIRLLRQLLAFDDSWHDAWHNLGLLYLRKEMYAEALSAFAQARLRDPTNPATLLNLGYLYDRGGQREQAVEAYLRVVRIQPSNVQAWYNLAVIAFELGQYRNATAALDEALARAPDDAPARALRQQVERAAANGPRAPAEQVDETERRCALAKEAVDEGRYADAIITLQLAAWFDEVSPLPHHYLANVYYLTGRLADAKRHQRQALARAPNNELYRRNLAALEAASPP